MGVRHGRTSTRRASMRNMKLKMPPLIAVLSAGLFATVGGAGHAAGLAPAPANNSAPTVTGSAQETQTLTAQTGAWTGNPAPRFTFSWERCDKDVTGCAAITGANSSTYRLQSADVGHTIRVNVTAINRDGRMSAAS